MTDHQKFENLMQKYLKEEITPEEKAVFIEHLNSCAQCRHELEEFEKLEEVMSEIKLKDPEDKLWEGYWASIYNKLERGLGWIFFSIGAIILVFYGLFKMVENIITDPTLAIIIKIGIIALILGLAVLVVSILRQQLFAYKKERYKEVKK